MKLSSLLYISRSTIAPAASEAIVRQIVATAVDANPRLGLTGALLFTGAHFAQVIEGESASIEIIMRRIRADPRHDDLVVVDAGAIAERRFADWSMVYFGPSQFVSRHVTRLLNDPSPAERRRTGNWLTDLLCEFAEQSVTVTR